MNEILTINGAPRYKTEYIAQELFDYAKMYMNEYEFGLLSWQEELQQVRALFTAACLVDNIEADTLKADNTLRELYDTGNISDYVGYDDFDLFMCGLIC